MRNLFKRYRLFSTFHSHWIAARCFCNEPATKDVTCVLGKRYPVDSWTNVSPSIIGKLGTNLHTQKHHPLGLLKLQIQNFFYKTYVKRSGNPIFSVYDNISPVVTLEQNYDHLLVPKDHPSRKWSDSYYINCCYMLRAHTTAHQHDLISSGLDSFLIVGDVYRRDTIDSTHYPAFHQLDGVRLFSKHELFSNVDEIDSLHLFENGLKTDLKQGEHTLEAALVVSNQLKSTLQNLAKSLFGKAGAVDKVGWAFGMGLERLAMKLYNISDIRLFWSKDPRFTNQFKVEDPSTQIKFKPLSKHPELKNDISFWIPANYEENNFYDLVRSVGGDLIENVELIDEFENKKSGKTSHCYRLIYRHMERPLTQDEVNLVHQKIATDATSNLGVVIR
ncbi:phenylalanine--tRNA ligase, mitochondrial-like isoform X2 [Mercenaria mercenaria]|uniref:phenylalanine--tRNA ligase, mitochondrial-like isoform X2 n=1 Tax=Mercenaria mercenaria TaxID=6596 RepID=UPI00234F6AA4|nr:phenylalanine--tRNA ligase, mitochondrial-like isoform X2 [Mercenaria mercenaria]